MSTYLVGVFVAIGERLREERKRLKMTQAVFAQTGGIGVSALKMYEGNEREPGALFLSEVANAGADVQYIITGVRSKTALASDEQVLLNGYRELDQATRKRLLAFVLTESGPVAIQKQIKEKATEQALTQIVTASGVGTQAAGKKIVNTRAK